MRTPAASITSLANDFEPSMRAASLVGPKQAMPAARTASATPRTSGTSGPMTTRSAPTRWASATTASPEVMSTSYWSAMAAVPALPGATASAVDLGVAAQRQQQRMFTGTGSDHEDVARSPTLIASAAEPRPYT